MLKEYTTSLPDGTAIHWRPITWGEYCNLEKRFESITGPAIWHLYDAVVGLCVIDWDSPLTEDFDEVPAGTIECIGEKILSESGFMPTREFIQKQLDGARGRLLRSYYSTGVAYICAAFHLKPNEVDELTIEEFMDYLAMAEIALGCDISMPSEEEAQKNNARYTEVIDPQTGKKLRVPVANQRGPQSRVDIQDGRRQQ